MTNFFVLLLVVEFCSIDDGRDYYTCMEETNECIERKIWEFEDAPDDGTGYTDEWDMIAAVECGI